MSVIANERTRTRTCTEATWLSADECEVEEAKIEVGLKKVQSELVVVPARCAPVVAAAIRAN